MVSDADATMARMYSGRQHEVESVTGRQSEAFFAYPGGKPLIGDAVRGAVETSKSSNLRLFPWEAMTIIGFKVDDVVRQHVKKCDVLVADVTYPNHNVFYELGYAISLGKAVVPTVNRAVEGSTERLQQIGLFDTLGWALYENAQELWLALKDWKDSSWTNHYFRPKDHSQPLFILDTLKKTDFRNHIFQSVENSGVHYRVFDPGDNPRLSAAKAISDITSSSGVIIPLLGSDIVDSNMHNLRAAFMLGLAHGAEIDALAIQYENAPVPLDYRDFVRNSTFKRETEKHVSDYCAQTLLWNQTASIKSITADVGILGDIDLGSPTAENETQKLSYYFVRTAEFARAQRAEGALVIGRKGSGKSAVFFQLLQTLSREKGRCIVDLRPASHNLSEMREALLTIVNHGIYDHTIAAFWQYVLYVEIVLKIREMVLPKSKNDFPLQQRIRALEEEFSLSESIVSGDFTSRLDAAVREVVKASAASTSAADLRSSLTNRMFEQPIPKLREAVASFRDHVDEIVILIDDLDKGWPPRRVESHDVGTIKHLIEVLNRIQRDLSRRKFPLRHLLFLRSDIYEQLVEETSDRGKYNPIKVDWSDPEQLRHLLRQRVVSNIEANHQDAAWEALNPRINGTTAVEMMIEGSLRRPRFLIDLCERTLSYAINRGHQRVTQSDVEEGLRQMSLYLVSDFGYELRDVAGTPERIFYAFIGKPELLTESELESILSGFDLGADLTSTIDLLLWYGFLGIARADAPPVFIYDRAYDFNRLEADRDPDRGEVLYAVNPAFLRGLEKN